MAPEHRKCTDPKHEGPLWLPLKEFHKKGRRNGVQRYQERCKVCCNREYKRQYWEEGKTRNDWEYKKVYDKARSRARTRLTKLVPELYEMVLHEELMKEPEYAEGRGKIG